MIRPGGSYVKSRGTRACAARLLRTLGLAEVLSACFILRRPMATLWAASAQAQRAGRGYSPTVVAKHVHTRSRTWVVAATTRRPNH